MNLRRTNLEKLADGRFDVLVVGAGINGAVTAASLSAKGLRVALIDKGDFAGSTSSNSSNLVWGGIKYLESCEFLLVNKLCKSRNHLMRSYPSTVKEIRFLTTIQKGFRFPPFLVFLGAVLYWFMGRFSTRSPRYLRPFMLKNRDAAIDISNASGGFEYSDCFLYDNDARFVFNFVKSSLGYGCVAANYVESIQAIRHQDEWQVTARDTIDGNSFTIKASVLVNACGPAVDAHNGMTGQKTQHHHVFSKGVHLIVDRITESERVLAFFASDGRLFFVIPMGPKTCIGTTDTQVDTAETQVTDEDRNFILDNVNQLLKLDKPLTAADIIAERCGVRPLAVKGQQGVADWVSLSRKHEIDVNAVDQHVSIFGGKLTDCINMGDELAEIVADLGVELPCPDKRWYGEPHDSEKQAFLDQAQRIKLDDMTDPSSLEPLTERLWRRYGTDAMALLDIIKADAASAKLLIANGEYLRCELEHAANSEMITCLDDFLRRRSKIALLVKRDSLIRDPGIKTACARLFGQQAEQKLQDYIDLTAKQEHGG